MFAYIHKFFLQASLLAAIHLVKAGFIHASTKPYFKVYFVVIKHVLECGAGAKWSFFFHSRGISVLSKFQFFIAQVVFVFFKIQPVYNQSARNEKH